jgi:hypothetical protein
MLMILVLLVVSFEDLIRCCCYESISESSIDPCRLNVGMVKLNYVQSAPSHEYDSAKRTLRERIDSLGTRKNPRTNATKR